VKQAQRSCTEKYIEFLYRISAFVRCNFNIHCDDNTIINDILKDALPNLAIGTLGLGLGYRLVHLYGLCAERTVIFLRTK